MVKLKILRNLRTFVVLFHFTIIVASCWLRAAALKTLATVTPLSYCTVPRSTMPSSIGPNSNMGISSRGWCALLSAQKTILGQSIVNCRPFSIDGFKSFKFLGSYNDHFKLPFYPIPEVAFVGRSNVGKSSLINTLTGKSKHIAVESKTAGRTQSINIFNCKDKSGDICVLVDLPGYGYAKASKTVKNNISTLVRSYLLNRGALKVVFLLIDTRREMQQSDYAMMQLLWETGISYVLVGTKVDKLKKNKKDSTTKMLSEAFYLAEMSPAQKRQNLIPFSSVTGEGKRDIWKAILNSILTENLPA